MLNATGIETPRLAKEKASKKIDLAVALAMACCAALQAGKPLTNSYAVPITVGRSLFGLGRNSALRQPLPGSLRAAEERPGQDEAMLFHSPLSRYDEDD